MEGAKVSDEIVPQVFENKEFGTIRAMRGDDGEPWFVAKDVCDALELSNVTVALQRLDDDERAKFNLGRQGDTNVVNEAGLYTLILGSKKKEAHAFKRWVTHEVLPAIRRDGGYMVARDETPEETMARALLIAQEAINRKDSTIAAQRDTIRELSPKAAFFDAVGDSDGKMSVADLSKALRQAGIGMGQNRLFKWFRDNGYMGKRGIHRNRPTQRSIEQGLFYLHDTTFVRRDGKVFNSFTPMVTAKGATVFFKAISKQQQISIEF